MGSQKTFKSFIHKVLSNKYWSILLIKIIEVINETVQPSTNIRRNSVELDTLGLRDEWKNNQKHSLVQWKPCRLVFKKFFFIKLYINLYSDNNLVMFRKDSFLDSYGAFRKWFTNSFSFKRFMLFLKTSIIIFCKPGTRVASSNRLTKGNICLKKTNKSFVWLLWKLFMNWVIKSICGFMNWTVYVLTKTKL